MQICHSSRLFFWLSVKFRCPDSKFRFFCFGFDKVFYSKVLFGRHIQIFPWVYIQIFSNIHSDFVTCRTSFFSRSYHQFYQICSQTVQKLKLKVNTRTLDRNNFFFISHSHTISCIQKGIPSLKENCRQPFCRYRTLYRSYLHRT